jgi:hypothetical protein
MLLRNGHLIQHLPFVRTFPGMNEIKHIHSKLIFVDITNVCLDFPPTKKIC